MKKDIKERLKKIDRTQLIKIIKKFPYILSYVEDESTWEYFIDINSKFAIYIEDLPQFIQTKIVERLSSDIKFIKNPDKEVQLAAVKEDGNSIQYIKNPDKEIQLEAVKEDVYSIQYIKNPDKEVQLEAVKKNGLVIQYIENPNELFQMEAVYNNIHSIKYIENPSENTPLLYEIIDSEGFVNINNLDEKYDKITEFLLSKFHV